jgi:N-acetyl-beta-hexosaminidase
MKIILRTIFSFFLITYVAGFVHAQTSLDSLMPVRAFCIGVPKPAELDSFITFIHQELAPRKVNTLILEVDYHYQFKSHPELIDSFALSHADVKKIVKACRMDHIRIIPMIDLLGHQSWANRENKLLQVYPQFDETPWIKMPAHYVWPNADDLYCKSYCPLAPGLHAVLFAVIDELCDVFHANAFHAGMDEVFYLGEDKCPRCGGRDKAELFADEVRRIHDHLALQGREMWMWGDRFLDGKTTGLGEWEASYNDTYRAIDLVPKDIVICDWHYDRPDKTAVYFAMKGFRVVTCSWNKPDVAVQQVRDMEEFRQQSTPEMKVRFYGMAETVWSKMDMFFKQYYHPGPADSTESKGVPECFKQMFAAIDQLGK